MLLPASILGAVLCGTPSYAADTLPKTFLFPKSAADGALQLAIRHDGIDSALSSTRPSSGGLVIDGKPTGFRWDGTFLLPYRLDTSHYLLEPSASDRNKGLPLWDADHRRLTHWAKIHLEGRVLVEEANERLTLFDVDPKTFTLRMLWKAKSKTFVRMISPYHGGLRLLVEQAGRFLLVTLEPSHATKETPVAFGEFIPTTYDGIREDRILLAHFQRLPGEASLAEVGIFDLATGKVRLLPQKAVIGVTMCQNAIVPKLALDWANDVSPSHLVPICNSVANYVDEKTERMVTIGHK
jgi:hypothetical protein